MLRNVCKHITRRNDKATAESHLRLQVQTWQHGQAWNRADAGWEEPPATCAAHGPQGMQEQGPKRLPTFGQFLAVACSTLAMLTINS
jgi:hypothetical protein